MSSVAPEGEVQIKARKKHESSLELPPGSAIHWEFRLHSKDIGFSAQFERETESGQVEQEQVCLVTHCYVLVPTHPLNKSKVSIPTASIQSVSLVDGV
eukprot:COSAG02_NODE_2255_length_9345_cov_3.269414_6_plen_98_part_00